MSEEVSEEVLKVVSEDASGYDTEEDLEDVSEELPGGEEVWGDVREVSDEIAEEVLEKARAKLNSILKTPSQTRFEKLLQNQDLELILSQDE